jgi:cell volume regulation protein A
VEKQKIRELSIPWDLLFVLVIRNGKRLIPNGKTVLHENDIVVVSAPVYQGSDAVQFGEKKVHSNSQWIGRKISDYAAETGMFVVLIKRGANVVIPRGPTDIEKGDVLVTHIIEKETIKA